MGEASAPSSREARHTRSTITESSGGAAPSLLPGPPGVSDRSVLIMALTSDGRVWKWDAQLPRFSDRTFIASTTETPILSITGALGSAVHPAPPATPPHLLAMWHGLQTPINTLSLFPKPVPLSAVRSLLGPASKPVLQPGPGPGPGHQHEQLALLAAAVTASGSLEICTIQRGQVSPLAINPALSLSVHKDSVKGVRWLGVGPCVVTFISEKTSHGFRNALAITDVRTRRSMAFREVASEANPIAGLRASPLGNYVLVILKGAPSELWAIGPERPVRLRLLDLPFTAVEWVLPDDTISPAASLPASASATWGRAWSPTPADSSSSNLQGQEQQAAPQEPAAAAGSSTPQGLQRPPHQPVAASMSPAPSGPMPQQAPQGQQQQQAHPLWLEELSEELIAFTLGDGRAGVLSVKGRRVQDTRAKAPFAGALQQPFDIVATALVAFGKVVVLGDAEGRLTVWDTSSGRCSSMPTGFGLVRRLQISPPPNPRLYSVPEGVTPILARVGVLFAGGQFGVYELDTAGRMRAGHAATPVCAKAGRAIDIGWLPLPWSAGGGSVLAAVTEDGSLSLLDTAQAADRRPSGQQRALILKHVLSTPHQPHLSRSSSAPSLPPASGSAAPAAAAEAGSSSSSTLALAAPEPVGTSLLLPRSWSLLLRLLLQVGVSRETLRHLMSSQQGQALPPQQQFDAHDELLATLPKPVHRALLALLQPSLDGEGGDATAASTAGPAHSRADQGQAARPVAGAEGPGAAGTSADADADAAAVGAGVNTLVKAVSDAFRIMRISTFTTSSPPQPGASIASSTRRRSQTGSTDGSVAGGTLGLPLSAGRAATPAGLSELLTLMAELRGQGQLLHETEWRSYTKALQSGSVAERMAVAARVAGSVSEAQFWRHLPSTLQAIRAVKDAAAARKRQAEAPLLGAQRPDSARPSPGRPMPVLPPEAPPPLRPPPGHAGPEGAALLQPGGGSGAAVAAAALKQVPVGSAVKLWDEDLTLAEAQERTIWHEAMSRALFDNEMLQERRMLEYVVLGDFQTAVAFLLASSPERSARYYRDAVCTMALAAASSVRDATNRYNGTLLHVQAAKVISAHASSVGDVLLGVPLHCSAGLYIEAVAMLQDTGLWRYAANLIAHALTGADRAAALQRWAMHVRDSEGSIWRCVGILTSAGLLPDALRVLLDAGLPDCASAYVAACQQAGLVNVVHPPPSPHASTHDLAGPPSSSSLARDSIRSAESAELDNVFGAGPSPKQQGALASHGPATTQAAPQLELYSVSGSSSYGGERGASGGGSLGGTSRGRVSLDGALDLMSTAQHEFERYVQDLLTHLHRVV